MKHKTNVTVLKVNLTKEKAEKTVRWGFILYKAGYIFFFSSSPPARKAVSLYGASVARSLCEGYGATVARSVCVCVIFKCTV